MKEPKQPSKIIKSFYIEGATTIRIKSNSVKNKKLTTSSKKWLGRHINDEFTQKSKIMGYRARSAFKLIEIQEKFQIIKNSDSVLDLGCAPGGWSEILVKYTKNVIGIDLLETQPLIGATFLQGDFLDENIQNEALLLNNHNKFNVIVSDISPNTSGMKVIDHFRIMNILEMEIQFVMRNLKTNGHFIAKIFQGEGTDDKVQELRKIFKVVKIFKPKSSRKESKEVYLVCVGFVEF